MDAVISYVNNTDPIWISGYNRAYPYEKANERRYADLNTLKYVLRGISEHMPFIDNVWLIVQSHSQVPDYVNMDTVNIVLHEDIIPQKHLPTYNSCTIEMFMSRIDGLCDEFVYFNDDMIPIGNICESDLFVGGKPCISFNQYDDLNGQEIRAIARGCAQAAKFLSNSADESIIWPKHTITPMLRSINIDCVNRLGSIIDDSITIVRNHKNLSQYLFADYYYYSGMYEDKMVTLDYIRTDELGKDNLDSIILNNDKQTICINDMLGHIKDMNFDESREVLSLTLDKKLPNKGKYCIC